MENSLVIHLFHLDTISHNTKVKVQGQIIQIYLTQTRNSPKTNPICQTLNDLQQVNDMHYKNRQRSEMNTPYSILLTVSFLSTLFLWSGQIFQNLYQKEIKYPWAHHINVLCKHEICNFKFVNSLILFYPRKISTFSFILHQLHEKVRRNQLPERNTSVQI